ncbi:hypothetical protein HpBT081_02420 [Helicobacter pylori]
MKKDREKNSNIANTAIVGAVSEESALYASANKEYLAILDDKTLRRTLKRISKYKVNPKVSISKYQPTSGLFCGTQRASPCQRSQYPYGKWGEVGAI